jgi:hypothetical protein
MIEKSRAGRILYLSRQIGGFWQSRHSYFDRFPFDKPLEEFCGNSFVYNGERVDIIWRRTRANLVCSVRSSQYQTALPRIRYTNNLWIRIANSSVILSRHPGSKTAIDSW